MNIQHSKTYKNGRGDVVYILDELADGTFMCALGQRYFPDGVKVGYSQNTPANLVEELKD